MKRILLTTTAAIGVAVIALSAIGGATAQQGQPGTPGGGPGWGMTQEQRAERHQEMFKALDADGDGTVSQEEFTNRANSQAMQQLREKWRAERRAAHFSALDADNDGTISQEEWRNAPQTAMGPGMMRGQGMMGGQGMGPGMMMDPDDMPRGMGPGMMGPGQGMGQGMGPGQGMGQGMGQGNRGPQQQ